MDPLEKTDYERFMERYATGVLERVSGKNSASQYDHAAAQWIATHIPGSPLAELDEMNSRIVVLEEKLGQLGKKLDDTRALLATRNKLAAR